MSDNDLIRRGDALVKAPPFCESQGDEWDRGYNTAISHYQVALLALTAVPGSPTCRVCGWPFVSPHYPPCTGHEVPWKDVDALLKRAEAAEAERDRLAAAQPTSEGTEHRCRK